MQTLRRIGFLSRYLLADCCTGIGLVLQALRRAPLLTPHPPSSPAASRIGALLCLAGSSRRMNTCETRRPNFRAGLATSALVRLGLSWTSS